MSRLPRFKRVTKVAPIQLTERDHEIIRLIHRHRFLRSHQIIALIGGSAQNLPRRLQWLFHHGYLERPRAQLQYYERNGSEPIVYGLGNKSGLLLQLNPASLGEKNRGIGRMYLAHALLVSAVMVSLELACRQYGKGEVFIWADSCAKWQEILCNKQKRRPVSGSPLAQKILANPLIVSEIFQGGYQAGQ